MNKVEKQLLKDLKEPYHKQGILSDIKDKMGAIAYVLGNPHFKAEIQITVNKTYDTGGVEVLPAALNPALQTQMPVYLLGLTDWQGGYLRSRQMLGLNQNWYLNAINLIINIVPVFPFNLMSIGDINIIFTDTLGLWTTCNIWIHCNNVAYGTFLNSFASDLITLNMIRYGVPIISVNQLINPLIFGYQTLFGRLATESIDPRMYITNQTFQQQIADIPINLPIDKNLMLNTQMEYDCQQITFNLAVNKVEPLTHKIRNS